MASQSQPKKSVAGAPEGGQARGIPAPFALPLAEIGHYTRAFREAEARRHELAELEYRARELAAWDARPRAAPEPLLVGHLEREPGLPSETIGATLLEPLMRPGAVEPGYDPVPTVTRRRARWRPWLTGEPGDENREARRSKDTRKVEIDAWKAHAASASWRRARAGGQRSRMSHVGACGTGVLSIECGCCGVVHESPVWCGCVRLCPGCNQRRSLRMQARFGTALEVVLEHGRKAGSFKKTRPGGALSEKHIALTAPHLYDAPDFRPVVQPWGAWGWASTSYAYETALVNRKLKRKAIARRRVETLLAANARFVRRLQAWIREPWEGRKAAPTVGLAWHRAFEWTRGADGLGHPHLHLWALTPWIPEHDDHRVTSITGGATTKCAAPRRLRGAWGWAETMRREQCAHCVGREAVEVRHPEPDPLTGRTVIDVEHQAEPAPAGAWGWARSLRRERALDVYYAGNRARLTRWKSPAVERRTGLRTWWADALAAEGNPVDERRVSVIVRRAKAEWQIGEVQKKQGLTFGRKKRVQIRDETGGLIRYFEGWCVAFQDRETWEVSGPEVIAGVYEALEGKRLSQSSKVLLARRDGSLVRVGLLGIADAKVDASCRDCNAHSYREGKGHPGFPERKIDVVTYQRINAARAGPRRAPTLSDGTTAGDAWQETYAALVARLRRAEATERGESAAAVRRVLDIAAEIRREGPALLPVYRRGRVYKARPPETFRGRMKRAAKERA